MTGLGTVDLPGLVAGTGQVTALIGIQPRRVLAVPPGVLPGLLPRADDERDDHDHDECYSFHISSFADRFASVLWYHLRACASVSERCYDGSGKLATHEK